MFKKFVVLKRTVFLLSMSRKLSNLTSETVEGTSLPFQSIYNVHSSDSFPFSVFSVCNSITDNVFQENFEDTTCFFVDQTRNTFYSTTTSQSSDCWFCDTLDVIT